MENEKPVRQSEIFALALFFAITLVSTILYIDFRASQNLEPGSRVVNIYEKGEKPVWIEEPEDMSDEESFIYEVTRFANDTPTQQNYEAAWRLYNESFESAKDNGWFDFETATEDGYIQLNSIHWAKPEHLFDQENLESKRPESLVYYQGKDGEKRLAGMMFYTDSLGTEGEQIGGPLTLWHYHPHWNAEKPVCFRKRMSQRLNITERSCPENNTKGYRTPEMMHVWFIKHPEGQFASRMTLPLKQVPREPVKMNKKEFMEHMRKTYREYRKN